MENYYIAKKNNKRSFSINWFNTNGTTFLQTFLQLHLPLTDPLGKELKQHDEPYRHQAIVYCCNSNFVSIRTDHGTGSDKVLTFNWDRVLLCLPASLVLVEGTIPSLVQKVALGCHAHKVCAQKRELELERKARAEAREKEQQQIDDEKTEHMLTICMVRGVGEYEKSSAEAYAHAIDIRNKTYDVRDTVRMVLVEENNRMNNRMVGVWSFDKKPSENKFHIEATFGRYGRNGAGLNRKDHPKFSIVALDDMWMQSNQFLDERIYRDDFFEKFLVELHDYHLTDPGRVYLVLVWSLMDQIAKFWDTHLKSRYSIRLLAPEEESENPLKDVEKYYDHQHYGKPSCANNGQKNIGLTKQSYFQRIKHTHDRYGQQNEAIKRSSFWNNASQLWESNPLLMKDDVKCTILCLEWHTGSCVEGLERVVNKNNKKKTETVWGYHT